MLQATESLLPILLLLGLGAGLSRIGFLSNETRVGMDKFTYWVALPGLFLHQLGGTDFQGLETGRLVLVLGTSMLAAALVATLIALLLRLKSGQSGVFVQGAFRGNMAFVGLPLIIFALGEQEGGDLLVTSALIGLAAMVPLNNLISVLALVIVQHGLSFLSLGKSIVKVMYNPLIVSALLGIFLGWFQIPVPLTIDRSLDLLGQTALALALVSLGAALVQLEMKGRVGLASIGGATKVVIVPLITYGLALLWQLPAEQVFIVMIFAACPTATASYILTTQLGGDDSLAAATILMSTLLSFPALAVVLILF